MRKEAEDGPFKKQYTFITQSGEETWKKNP